MTQQATEDERAQYDVAAQMILYARDLATMVREAEARAEALARANERLARVDRLKTDFLTFICHELRTPLTSMAMISLLESERLDDSARAVADLVKAGYERLERFVARALEYFRLMTEDGARWEARTELRDVVLREVQKLDRVAITLDLPADACPVRGDPEALGRVLAILLENAVKHSDATLAVTVSVRRDGARTRLSVADRGRGFEPEMAAEILQPFTSADVAHHGGGSGLSLPLAVLLVERCGGRLSATSAGHGTGATFTVELDSLPEPEAVE